MCFVRAAELLESDWLREASAQLVLVGSGSGSVGRAVAEKLGVFAKGGKLVVDDSKDCAVYLAFGAKQGILRTFAIRRLDNISGLLAFPLNALKSRTFPTIGILDRLFGREGKKAEGSAGNPFQQGGTFVLDESAQLVFRLVEESPGYPRADPRALRRAVERGERYGLVTIKARDSPPWMTFVFYGFVFVISLALVWMARSAREKYLLPL